jgi:hypothetical protein
MGRPSFHAEICWTAAMCVALTSCAVSSPELTSNASTISKSITSSYLIGPDGQCDTDLRPEGNLLPVGALGFSMGPKGSRDSREQPSRPRLPASPASGRGITLGMTECDLIGVAGPAEKFEQSSIDGQRVVVLTYLHGQRPGIYRFLSGRLKVVERLPDPPKKSPNTVRQNKS